MPAIATKPAAVVKLTVEFDREDDGRWIAEVPQLPGVIVYGSTREESLSKAQALALRVLADRVEENKASTANVQFACA